MTRRIWNVLEARVESCSWIPVFRAYIQVRRRAALHIFNIYTYAASLQDCHLALLLSVTTTFLWLHVFLLSYIWQPNLQLHQHDHTRLRAVGQFFFLRIIYALANHRSSLVLLKFKLFLLNPFASAQSKHKYSELIIMFKSVILIIIWILHIFNIILIFSELKQPCPEIFSVHGEKILGRKYYHANQ